MQIIPSDGKFELRSKDISIQLGNEIKIGDFEIPGPGEYEVGGIMAEVTALAVHFQIEDLTVGYLFPRETPFGEKDLEQFGSIDVLFVPLNPDSSKFKEAEAVITQIESPIVIPVFENGAATQKYCLSHGSCEQATGSYKLTKSLIPTEGMRMIVFTEGAAS